MLDHESCLLLEIFFTESTFFSRSVHFRTHWENALVGVLLRIDHKFILLGRKKSIFDKLPNTTLREQIATKIRAAILTGQLAEGERLVERKLAGQFDTSLTAVREALIELESEGFVLKKTNSGTYVTKLSLEDTEKIFAVRKVLEGYAVEEAARLATPEQKDALSTVFHELVDSARANDAAIFSQKDFAVHDAIWRIADNEHLQTILQRLVGRVITFARIRVIRNPPFDRLKDAFSHAAVIEAIKENDPISARAAYFKAWDKWLNDTRSFFFGPPSNGGT